MEERTKEESILKKCERFREEGKKFLKNFEDEKSEQERFYSGEHWKQKSPENRPKNHVFQIIESEIPLLMDPMPSTDVIAIDDDSNDRALVLQSGKDHVYRQQNLFLKDAQTIRKMLKTGSGYQYVDYDTDGEGGEGSITVKLLNRKQVIKDPAADTLDECRYVIIDSAISHEDGKRRFPKTWDEACKQSPKDLYIFAGTKGAREDRNIPTHDGKEVSRYDSKDISFIEEYWLKDYSLEAIPDDETQIQLTEESAQLQQGINPDITKWEDHNAHIQGHKDQKDIILQEALASMGIDPAMATEQDIENLKANVPEVALLLNIIDDHIEMHMAFIDSMDESEVGKRPKYPNNLRLVIKTGDVLHYDDVPPVDDGMVPLVEFECYKDEGPAEGEVKHLIPMQKTLNELEAKEFKGLKVVTNPGWVVDEESGIDTDTLTDDDGIIVTKKSGTEAQRLPPGQVSPQLENRSRREYEAMQRIAGVGETVFGESPKSQTSGVMYRRMQMQALGRIRLKSRMIEAAIFRRDQLIVSRIMKYWSAERLLRADDANGKIKFVKFEPKMMRDFKYTLILSPGTVAGMDNETIAETYKELFLAGAIDLKTYARLTNLPKKQDLLDILEEQDQTKAQIQEMQTQNQELQKQMLMMKANLAPNLLTPEEIKVVEQFALEEQQAQVTQNPLNTAVE